MSGGRLVSRRLTGCVRGATAVEFALLAPVFFVFLFGILEFGRLLWVSQTVNEISYSTARCMSASSSCANTAGIQSYAIQRAAASQLNLVAANIVPASNVTCNGNASSNQVTITYIVTSPVRRLIPILPGSIVTQGCFPKLS